MQELPEILRSYGVELRPTTKRGEYIACCIAHDDRTPSMSVYVNGSGKYTTHCHACGFHEDAAGVIAHIENITMPEALKRLDDKTYGYGEQRYQAKHKRTLLRMTFAPPKNAPAPRMDWLKDADTGEPFGAPSDIYEYRARDGRLQFVEARYIVAGKKECRVFTWGRREGGEEKWECAHWVGARPLYGMETVKDKGQIIIGEGPRKARAIHEMLGLPAIGWSGGAKSWSKSDWAQIIGRDVVLWPDADDVGREAMYQLAQLLIVQDCRVYILDTHDLPQGFDAADLQSKELPKDAILEWCRARKGIPILREEPKQPKRPPRIEGGKIDPDTGIYWPEPYDLLAEMTSPKLDPQWIPEQMRPWLMDCAAIKGVDPAILLITSLVGVASLIDDDLRIQPEQHNHTWRESCRLWGAIVGDPSIKKTPAMVAGLHAITKLDNKLAEGEPEIRRKNAIKERIYKAAEKEYEEQIKAGNTSATLPPAPELDPIPRIKIQNATVEAIEMIMANNTRGMLAEQDELVGWFGAMDAYKSKQGSDRGAWLQLFNGGPRRVDRIGRGSIRVPNFGVSLIGAIQPDPMREICRTLHEDGLLQRFLVVIGKPGTEGNEQEPDAKAFDQWEALQMHIYGIKADRNHPVKLSSEANNIRKEITRKIAELMQINFLGGQFTAHLGKWDGLVARMMLLMHVLECAADGAHPQSRKVSGEAAQATKTLMLEFFLKHSIVFYSNVSANSATTGTLRAIAKTMITLCATTENLTRSTLMTASPEWRKLTEQAQESALARLETAGWIKAAPGAKTKYMTKSIAPLVYIINPALADIYADIAKMEQRRAEIIKETFKSIGL